MSNIKALEDLRELATGSHSYISNGRVLKSVDEIEREITECYIELPVDAEGVPIRAGDAMMREDGGPTRQVACVCGAGFTDIDTPIWCARDFRHVKPRTIEDVLEEFLIEFDDWDWNTGDNDRDNARKQLFAKYADEIREVLVGDAE